MKNTIRISHLGHLESAPLLAALDQGFFSQEKLAVELSCDLGVAAICGKLTDGRIDGACLPAQMPVLLSLGAGVSKVAMTPVFLVSSEDMALVLTPKASAPEKGRPTSPVLKIGVLGHSSPGCHLVKTWIQAHPGVIKNDPVYVSLAASQLVHFFDEGLIDGFCGMDPMPALARIHGGGLIAATSATLSPHHPGSVIALRDEVLAERPAIAEPLARALRRGREFCAHAANHDKIWALLLAQNPYGYIPEDQRIALVQQFEAATGNALSRRFEARKKSNALDAAGARFIELACRAATGIAEKHFDFGAEIARIYLGTFSTRLGALA
jgi:ABC-type nitrate/sulfonate/bicarbonate transport system substrate-binding protein